MKDAREVGILFTSTRSDDPEESQACRPVFHAFHSILPRESYTCPQTSGVALARLTNAHTVSVPTHKKIK